MPKQARPVGPVGRRFARHVRMRREELRMTKVELAQRLTDLGMAATADVLTKIENADRHVDVDDFGSLLRALEMVWRPELLSLPAACWRCHGEPPVGFTCNICRLAGR